MVKSIYLNYQADNQGNKPYKFVVSLDETLKLPKNSEVALHNVELERPIITLDTDQSFYIYLNPYGGNSQEHQDFSVEDNLVSNYTLTPAEVLAYETETDQKKTFQCNSFYRNLLPNIYISIGKGVYSKNGFLETVAFQANQQILEFFRGNLIQFYNPYRFAVVNDGEKTFLGLYNESKLIPGRISSVPGTYIPDIVNSNNMSDDGLSSIKIADFTTTPSNLAYPSAQRYLINTERSIYLDANADNIYTSFCFLNSSVNILNNKQDNLTDRQNSGLQFTLNFSEAGQDEYFAGFLSQCYQMTHWPDKNVPQLIEIKGLDGIELPTCYCGLYFRKEADGVFLHVVGVANPYYAVDTFDDPELPADRYLCYRNSTTPIEYMNVLYSTFIPTSTSIKEKGVYGIEFYYRYSKQNKSLVYQNAAEQSFIPENVRIYFRVYCGNGIDSKTNNRVIFDSRTIDYYFSHEMLKENYLIFNPDSMQSAVFADAGVLKRDIVANLGVAGGFVPFLAMANVAETGSEGFYNLYFNATRLYDYQQARTIPDPNDNLLETGYFRAAPAVEVEILGKYDYLPLGIYSYGFGDMNPQIARIFGTIPSTPMTPDPASALSAYNGFSPNRFPFDINAELGIYSLFTEGNKYHIILKNIPLAAMANTAYQSDTSKARRQNIVYTVRQSDLNITNVETNSLTITHYPHMLKYLSLYNNNDINLNSIEVEIRNATTGKYAEELTDCSLEILFNEN
jgi:hypothetical protein